MLSANLFGAVGRPDGAWAHPPPPSLSSRWFFPVPEGHCGGRPVPAQGGRGGGGSNGWTPVAFFPTRPAPAGRNLTSVSPASSAVRRRPRNRRGEGRRLRDEIVAAATDLLELTGSVQAVTLRAVARQVGIAAIYPHFPDRQAIIAAVRERVFQTLSTVLEAAAGPVEDPVLALRSGCEAYVHFAIEQPALYRAVFGEGLRQLDPARPSALTDPEESEGEAPTTGVPAFDLLVTGIRRCVEAGRSASVAPYEDAAALWMALHGMATLTAAGRQFPWPDLDELLDTVVQRLARIA